MPLQLIVDSLDSVPEERRGDYVERDGKFLLDIDDVEQHPNLAGLREGIRREREARQARESELKKFKGVDLDRWARVQDLDEEELEEFAKWRDGRTKGNGSDSDEVKKRIASVTKQHERLLQERDEKLSESEKRIDALTAELARTKIETRLMDACGQLNVVASAHEDVLNAGGRVFRIDEEGRVVAMDKDGAPILGKDGNPLDPKAWLEQRQSDKPHWFTPSRGGGAGGGGGATGGVSKKADLKTAADQAAYIRKHGREAYLNLPR